MPGNQIPGQNIRLVVLALLINFYLATNVEKSLESSGFDTQDDDQTQETHLWSRLTEEHSRKRLKRNLDSSKLNGMSRKIVSENEEGEFTSSAKIISLEKVNSIFEDQFYF